MKLTRNEVPALDNTVTAVVPDKITRAQVTAACEALGVDPSGVMQVTMTAETVDIVVYWATSEGARVLMDDEGHTGYAKTTVGIPVTRELADTEDD